MPDEENEIPKHEPDSPESMAYHTGRLTADMEEVRREWSLHKTEMAELKTLVTELQSALTKVEEVAEEISQEEHPEMASLAPENAGAHAEPEAEKGPHWTHRFLAG